MTLNELFKNTTYDDTLFSAEAKSAIESRIFMKPVRGTEVPYITCAIRNKDIKLTPEEAVRQLYIYMLMNNYGYMASRIQLETPIHFGREVKRADIAIMDKDRPKPFVTVCDCLLQSYSSSLAQSLFARQKPSETVPELF